MYKGLFFISKKTFDRYSPIIPRNKIINPPRSHIDNIIDVNPSSSFSKNKCLSKYINEATVDENEISKPAKKIILRGFSLNEVIELNK